MKNYFRIIPWLQIKNSNLIQGLNMEGLRTIGNPIDFAKNYYENNADEIVLYDVVASLYDQKTLLPIISKISKNIFIPLVVSGGIKSLQDIRNVLRAGADRVCLNSVTFIKKNFVSKAVEVFGSSTISINLQVMKLPDHKYYCYYHNGREKTGKELNYWINYLAEQGAGEFIISSINREGTLSGVDTELIKYINIKKNIPIIIHGGCNGSEANLSLIKYKIDGFAVSSLLHYYLVKKKFFPKYINKFGNFDYLNSNCLYSEVKNTKFYSLKSYKKLMGNSLNINIRS